MTTTIALPQLRVRASSADRAWACSASVPTDSDVIIDNAGDVARLGQAVHHWVSKYVGGDPVESDDIADAHGVDIHDLSPCVAYAKRFLSEYSRFFPNARAEVSTWAVCDDVRIEGTIDLVSSVPPTLRVADFKSGYKEPQAWHQIKAYLWMESTKGPHSLKEHFEGWVVWLRDRSFEKRTFTRVELKTWAEALADRIKKGRGSFYPGTHCEYCWRRSDCPGLREYARRQIAMLTDGTLESLAWTPETRALMAHKIVENVRIVRDAIKHADAFIEAVKADIVEHGALQTGDGIALAMVAQPIRELDPEKAWPILSDRLTDEEMSGCVKLSITAVEKTVGAKAGKGKGAAAKRDLGDALEAVHAIEMKNRWTLKEVDASQQLEAGQ